jgi:hypothetical protein
MGAQVRVIVETGTLAEKATLDIIARFTAWTRRA